MIVLSRFTPNGPYPAMAKKLAESCVKWGLRWDIQQVPASSGWKANENLKPRWILSKLIEAREAVLWLDADTEVIQPPMLLMGCSADFACYNWRADQGNTGGFAYDPQTLLCSGGVLMFGYTAAAVELALRWSNKTGTDPSPVSADQDLDAAFNQSHPPVNPLWLPKAYNRMDRHWPDVDPVINHEYRARSNGGNNDGHEQPAGGAVQPLPGGQDGGSGGEGCQHGRLRLG